MSSRGTQFGRTMEYFRTADIDEAKAAFEAAGRIVDERATELQTKVPQQRTRTRRRGVTAPAAGVSTAVTESGLL